MTAKYSKSPPTLDWQLILLGFGILFFVNINQLGHWTQVVDNSLYDNYLQVIPTSANEQILIVEIDEQSLSLIGDWPWPRSYHAQMIERLTQADAGVIAYNVVFSSFDSEDENDQLLAQAIDKSGRTILPLYFDRLTKEQAITEVLPALPFSQKSGLGHVNSYLDSDGTLRSIRLVDRFSDTQWPHFSFASFLFNQPYSEPLESAPSNVYVPFVNQGTFERFSFVDVLTGLITPEQLAQRTIFVGMTATSMGDPLITPVDDHGRQSPAVDINANIYQALENEVLIQALPKTVALLLNSIAILLFLYLIPRLSVIQQMMMTVTSFTLVWGLGYGLLQQGYWYLNAGLLISILAIPFVWNLWRLSRLLNYFRQQIKRLQKAQAAEVFHLPGYIRLKNETDLKALLSLMEIERFQLLPEKQLLDEGMAVVKYLEVVINNKEMNLALLFDDFNELERRKLNLLYQLIDSSKSQDRVDSKETSAVAGALSSDIFSQQLVLIESFQKQVETSHALFEASIEGIAAGILVTDLTGRVLFKNKALNDLVQEDVSELSELFNAFTLLKGEWVSILRDVILEQNPRVVEAKSDTCDLSISIRCIEGQQPLTPLLVFNVTDISDIKQAHRSRNEMIDFLSHDLRSPMASLQAMVHQARNASDIEELSITGLLDKVDRYSQRGLNFAEQFLELARVESNEEIALYEVDLYSVCQNAIDTLFHQAQEKSIKLSIDVTDDCWVMSNGELLERILLNLMGNAIKYSPEDSQVDLTVKLTSSGSELEIRVSDQGPGIPLDLMDALFKPYQRGLDANTQQAKGVGLGLRFVDVALKRLQSQIQLETSNTGTSFFFLLSKIDL